MKTLIKKLKALRLYFVRQRLFNMLCEIECDILSNVSSKYRQELIEEWNEINSRLLNVA